MSAEDSIAVGLVEYPLGQANPKAWVNPEVRKAIITGRGEIHQYICDVLSDSEGFSRVRECFRLMGFSARLDRKLAILSELAAENYFVNAFIFDERDGEFEGHQMDDLRKTSLILLNAFNQCGDHFHVRHSVHVANLANILAKEFFDQEWTEDQYAAFYYICILHDIGKLVVDPKVLFSRNKLSFFDVYALEQHVVNGMSILDQMGISGDIVRPIYEHHERLNGQGYPLEKRGNDISMEGRILGFADSVVAALSKRSYKAAKPLDAFINSLQVSYNNASSRKMAGGGVTTTLPEYDIELIEIFLANYDTMLRQAGINITPEPKQ